MQNFVDIIIPLPLNRRFTYAITDTQHAHLKPGMRVAVPFGKTKVYTGVVAEIHRERPRLYTPKWVEEILDEKPTLTPYQLRFFYWIAEYYMCSEGEILKAALPGAFLLQSETVIELNEEGKFDPEVLTDEEYMIYEALQNQSLLRAREVVDILGKKTIIPVLNNMVEKEAIVVNQELFKQYKPKKVRYVKLSAEFDTEAGLKKAFDDLERAPKQKKILLALLAKRKTEKGFIRPADLYKAAQTTPNTLKSMVDKGILEEYYLEEDRVHPKEAATDYGIRLSESQEEAYEAIKVVFQKKKPCLLHGVTASGKTEIYIKLIDEAIQAGKQVLYLVPEIALTTQLILRLQLYFGEEVLVYHSKYSINERVEVYKHVLHRDKGKIVIGVRSAIFLPFRDLGLIVVDEAHEHTFKQFDPAPRYQARDAAVVLAQLFDSRILLGTATPSLESYFNAQRNKYGLVNLKDRYGKIIPPKIQLIDLKERHRKKRMTGHFSAELIELLSKTIENGKQAILFQNRRGFSPILECQTCGHSPQCPNCDVSLTYHKHNNSLRCHYCGYHIPMMKKCPACGSVDLTTKGLGTEQVETELNEIFPKAKVGRMDLDTTRGKHGYEKLIHKFERKEIDIMVGTQMLAKGLDFRDVEVVGVMNADNLLNFPDFRAHERAFQLLTQVSGRAGRTDRQGLVLIQTYNPKHGVLQQVLNSDFLGMYEQELETRQIFKYPPFYRLIKLSLKGRNYNAVNQAAEWLSNALKPTFKENMLGPEFPPVARIRNHYYKVVLLKIPPEQSLKKIKTYLKKILESYDSISKFRAVRVIINVDPF